MSPISGGGHGAASITTDKSNYRVGDSIRICYTVPGPGPVNIVDSQSGRTVFSGVDDGTGGCETASITPPTGQECFTLNYQSTGGSGSTQACIQIASNQTSGGASGGGNSGGFCYPAPGTASRITCYDSSCPSGYVTIIPQSSTNPDSGCQLSGSTGGGTSTPSATVSITTDKSSYQLGDPIRICYTVSGPGQVTITDSEEGVVLSGHDDGRGGCLNATATPPLGPENESISFTADSGGTTSAQTTFSVGQASSSSSPTGTDITMCGPGTSFNAVSSPGPTATVQVGQSVACGRTYAPGPNCQPVSETFNFGDGSQPTVSSQFQGAAHVYTQPGVYTVVDSIASCPAAATATVTVQPAAAASSPLRISIQCVPTTLTAGQSTACTATTTDAVGNPAQTPVSWDFGDGTSAGNQLSVAHTYASPGGYMVWATMYDHGQPVSAGNQITVNPSSSSAGGTPGFSDTVSVDRGNGATYYIGDPIGVCFEVDSSAGGGANITITDTGPGGTVQLFQGTVALNQGQCGNDTVTPPVGSDTVSLVVNTINGQSISQGQTPATASYITQSNSASAGGGNSSSLGATASCTPQNPNVGDTVTCTASVTGAEFRLLRDADLAVGTFGQGIPSFTSWDFDDGSAVVSGQTVTHTYAASGAYSVSATVRDSSGGTAKATAPVNVKPGGVWISPCANGAVGDITGKHCPDPSGAMVQGHVLFAAKAYPTNRTTDLQIDHIDFTAQINGKWIKACTLTPQDMGADGNYSCDWWPGVGPQPIGQVMISFDVYDTAGNVNQAPNGEHSVTFDPSAPSLMLPFDFGQTWDVCQGYNGYPSDNADHVGYQLTALDLVYRPDGSPDPRGSSGCIEEATDPNTGQQLTLTNPVTGERVELKNMSQYMNVDAPAAGTLASYWSGKQDIVCLNFDAGGSTAIGHLSLVGSFGDHVAAGTVIGSVNPASTTGNQGPIAHIHIEVFPLPNCVGSPVAFTARNQARFQCAADLPLKGLSETNQYGGPDGVELRKC